MSLINDALRRANTQRPSDAQSSAPIPAMQPVELAPSSASRVLPWAVLVAGVGVLAIAAVLFLRGRAPETKYLAQNEIAAGSSPVPLTETPAQSTAEPLPAVKAEPQASVQQQPVAAVVPTPVPVTAKATPISQPAAEPVQPPPPVARTATAAVTPAVSAPAESKAPDVQLTATAPPEPKLSAASESQARPPRLQAIYYRLRKPTVLINGRTLGPGDSVDGIKIVSIQRSSVEVVQNGKYRTLTMQD